MDEKKADTIWEHLLYVLCFIMGGFAVLVIEHGTDWTARIPTMAFFGFLTYSFLTDWKSSPAKPLVLARKENDE